MENITLLIVEEDTEFLASVSESLDPNPEVEKILHADSQESAESQIACHNPDFIIMDLGFPELEKILSESRCSSNSPFILLTSYYDNEDYIRLAREMGANAFCRRDKLSEAVAQLIRYKKKGINSFILGNKFYLLN